MILTACLVTVFWACGARDENTPPHSSAAKQLTKDTPVPATAVAEVRASPAKSGRDDTGRRRPTAVTSGSGTVSTTTSIGSVGCREAVLQLCGDDSSQRTPVCKLIQTGGHETTQSILAFFSAIQPLNEQLRKELACARFQVGTSDFLDVPVRFPGDTKDSKNFSFYSHHPPRLLEGRYADTNNPPMIYWHLEVRDPKVAKLLGDHARLMSLDASEKSQRELLEGSGYGDLSFRGLVTRVEADYGRNTGDSFTFQVVGVTFSRVKTVYANTSGDLDQQAAAIDKKLRETYARYLEAGHPRR